MIFIQIHYIKYESIPQNSAFFELWFCSQSNKYKFHYSFIIIKKQSFISPTLKVVHCKSLKTYCEQFSWFEKYVLKWRKYQNVFLKTRKINSLRKVFLSLLQANLTWNKNISQNKTNFLNITRTSLGKKIFLVSRNLFLFWDHFLKLR